MARFEFGFERITRDNGRDGWRVEMTLNNLDHSGYEGKGHTEISALRDIMNNIKRDIKRSEQIIRRKQMMVHKIKAELRRRGDSWTI